MQVFELPPLHLPSSRPRRSAGGLLYLDTRDGVSEHLSSAAGWQPAQQLTDFKEMRIVNVARSRGGRQLALSRGTEHSDAVLMGSGEVINESIRAARLTEW